MIVHEDDRMSGGFATVWGSIEEIINSDFSIPYSSKSLYDTPRSMNSFVESVVGSRCAVQYQKSC